MKVALIGNMNNCFFSIMRYFRDLNIDAELFMYQSEQELFKPQNDTFYIDKYAKYIHILPIRCSVKSLLFLNKNSVKQKFEKYDIFIGCGMAPAIFLKLNIRLDIFIPYHDQIEYTINPKLNYKNFIKTLARRYVVNLQIKALKYNTTKIITPAIQELTSDSIERLDLSKKHVRNYLLMVYQEKIKRVSELDEIIETISNYDFIIFSHTRHFWQKKWFDYEHLKKEDGKGLDKLIVAYSRFIKQKHTITINPILIFLEYGPDVEASKALIQELGIEKNVLWLKRMPRKNILQLIHYADIVVDAISSTMWGGVGWEALSCGKIIMQNIKQTDDEYYKIMGHRLPFIMNSKSVDDIEKHLNSFIKNRKYYIEKGKENIEWFNNYAGIGLAKEYKALVEKLYRDKKEQ